jgi:hypothetical protein
MWGRMRLLVVGFSWLYILQPDPEHAGQRRVGELSRSRAGHLVHDAQSDRCHLSSVSVKMILIICNFDVHHALEDHFKNVSAASQNEEQQNGMMIIGRHQSCYRIQDKLGTGKYR